MVSNDIDQIIQKAEAARNNNEYPKALDILSDGLYHYPDNLELMVRYGWLLRVQGRFSEAIHTLKHAIVLKPDDYDILYNLAISFEGDAQKDEALRTYALLLDKYPKDPQARLSFIEANVTFGYPNKVLSDIQKLLLESPDSINIYMFYGHLLNEMGLYTNAIHVLEDGLVNKRCYQDAVIFLAESYYHLLRHDVWLETAKKAYAIDPDWPLANFWMAKACLQEQKFEEASQFLLHTLELHPRFFKAHIEIGRYCWALGELDEAERYLKEAVEVAPWSGEAIGVLAWFKAETKRGEIDLGKLEEMALETPYGGLPYFLGQIYLMTYRDYEQAERFLQIAVDCKKENIEYLRLLGGVSIFRRKFEAAITQFQTIIDLCPDFIEAWKGYGIALVNLGKFTEAESKYEYIIQHDSKDPINFYNYGITLKELGKKAEAIAQLEVAQRLGVGNEELLKNISIILNELR